MKIERMKWITREVVQANPDKIFLFGDNVQGEGFGGQAKEMRGETNAVGIPTKIYPTTQNNAYFHDDEFDWNTNHIDAAIAKVITAGLRGYTIVIPEAGLGTGLAQLDKRAPRTFAYLQRKLKDLEYLPQ